MPPVSTNALRTTHATAWLAAALLQGFSGWAQAQVHSPDTDRAVREAATAPGPGDTSFVLTALAFEGNTRFSTAALQALTHDAIGRHMTLDELHVLAERVTAHYRSGGYVLTRTVIQPQDVSGGRVTMTVIEGRLGRARIERLDDVPAGAGLIEGVAARLPTDRPLRAGELERTVLLLSDMPGVISQAALETGAQAGTYDLVIDVKAAPRYNFSADIDNQGSRATGELRIGASARVNGLLGRGDNLDLRLLTSVDKGLHFGRLSYELPFGADGWRASIAYGRVQYDLGKDFAVLDAYGSADVVEIAASYPVLRSRARNLFAKAGLEAKRLEDHIGAVAQVSNKRAHNLNLGLVFEARDSLLGGGYTSASANLYAGELTLRSQADLSLDQGPFGRDTAGRFVRVGFTASRLQALGRNVSVYLALAGQRANRNLDSADRIAIGGPRAVRAYSSAAGIGDEGLIANIELRWSVTAATSLSVFHDIGRVRLNRRAAASDPDNHRTLAGPGAALYWTFMQGAALRASLAWPERDPGAAATRHDQRSPRLYAQLVNVF